MTKTIEEKRAFVKAHLLAQANHAHKGAHCFRMKAMKAAAYGRFVSYRASKADEMAEAELDLLIDDWTSGAVVVAADHADNEANRASYDLLVEFLKPEFIQPKEGT